MKSEDIQRMVGNDLGFIEKIFSKKNKFKNEKEVVDYIETYSVN